MLTLDLLHRQLSYRMLRGREMPSVDARFVCVVTPDAQGREQSPEFQELRILPGAHDVGKHSARTMIQRLLEPPRPRFGADKTPHLIQLRGAPRVDAGGTGARTKRGEQGGVGVLQRGGFFLTRRSRSSG
jgi:hypothetical protein